MNATKYFLFFLLVSISSMGCKDTKEPKKVKMDPFESALPHGGSPENPLKLSNADLNKIANAKGKTVEIITSKTLFEKINSSSGALHLFYFWSVNDLVSKNMISSLDEVQAEFEAGKIKVHLVNFDDQISDQELNKSVRLYPHFEAYYKIPSTQKTDMLRLIYNNWNGKVPGLLVVNKTNATKSFFSNEFKPDELYAILQPLAL